MDDGTCSDTDDDDRNAQGLEQQLRQKLKEDDPTSIEVEQLFAR